MQMTHVAARNLSRRPARTILTVFGIGVAVAVVVALMGLAESFESTFLKLYTEQNVDLVVQRRGGTMQLSKGLPAKLGDRILALPGVEGVIGGLMDMIAFEEQGLFMVLVNGWAPDSQVLERIKIMEGRNLRDGDRRQVILGRVLAGQLNKHPGDTVQLYAQTFEVVGVFESFSIYENGAAFLLIDELQRQMDRKGQVTGFVIQVTPHGDTPTIERVQRDIEALDPEVAATPCAAFVHSLKQMQVTRTMALVVSAVAALLGACGMLNTMAMSIFERRREFGILRAIGWRPRRIVTLVLLEASTLAAAGACLGIAVGLCIPKLLTYWPPTVLLVQGDFSWTGIAAGCILAATTAILGAVYPAYSCATIPPVEALRSA
jgi:putative ABC transport system permease protein